MKSLFKWITSVKRELTLVFFALAVLIFLPLLLRFIDPSAGTADLGIVHLIVVGVVRAVIILLVLFVIVKAAFPLFENYVDEREIEKDWKAVTPTTRLILFFSFLSVLILMLTLCVVLL